MQNEQGAQEVWEGSKTSRASRQACGQRRGSPAEIEYERTKTKGLPVHESKIDRASLIDAIDRLSEDAADRDIDLLSLRRVAEALSLTSSGLAALQDELRKLRPT